MNTRVLLLGLLLCSSLPAWSRLGESEAQSQTRYGNPTPELIAATDKPLLPGGKEVAYNFEGWRIRAAFADDKTVRIEYARLPVNGALQKIDEPLIKAILDAEKGKFSWREEKPRTGNKDLNALHKYFEGRVWERSDHAKARLVAELLLQFETRDAAAIEAKLGKKTSPPGTSVVPKF